MFHYIEMFYVPTEEGKFSCRSARLNQFSFIQDKLDASPENAARSFGDRFSDPKEIVDSVKERANFRDKVIYAQDGGRRAKTRSVLDESLKEHAITSLGLIWAAIEMTDHSDPGPFVLQVLGGRNETIAIVRPPKHCKNCGKPI